MDNTPPPPRYYIYYKQCYSVQQKCNDNRGDNTANFLSVPLLRMYTYRGLCYDLEPIIKKFNENWYKPEFNFTINNVLHLSLDTLVEIAGQVNFYNSRIKNRSNSAFLFYTGPDDSLVYGETIKMADFITLLFEDLASNERSMLSTLIVEETRSRVLLLVMRILYLCSNHFTFETVKPFYQTLYPRYVSTLESDHPILTTLINSLYSNHSTRLL